MRLWLKLMLVAALMVLISLGVWFAVFSGWRVNYGRTNPHPDAGLNPAETSEGFWFAVTADMRQYSGEGQFDNNAYFRGATEAIASLGGVSLMVTPGDFDPAYSVYWTITNTLGVDFKWYPTPGNHDLPGGGREDYPGENLDWLRAYDYGTVNPGPSGCPITTYSVDYLNAHFVLLNVYCDSSAADATNGDINDHLYNWLEADLQANTQPFVFVFGHEPAFPQADRDTGRQRHMLDGLNMFPVNRDRFWRLLRQYGVQAYFNGHTHNYSGIYIMDIWQFDAGHARGLGDPGAPSTFILVYVSSSGVSYQTYRDDALGGAYNLRYAGNLGDASSMYLPLVVSP